MFLDESNFFKKINYDSVQDSNVFYKKILNNGPLPRPKFYSIIGDLNANKTALDLALTQKEELERFASHSKSVSREELSWSMRSLLHLYPRDDMMLLFFARLYISKELYGEAQNCLTMACHANPENSTAWALQGLIAALANDHGRVLECSEKAIKLGNNLHNSMPKAWLFTKLLFGRTGQFQIFSSSLLFDETVAQQRNHNVTVHRQPSVLNNGRVLLFSCDESYFEKFGKILLTSIGDVEQDLTLHVHIIGPMRNILNWIDEYTTHFRFELIVSNEEPPADLQKNLSFLASCRFLRAPMFMRKFQRAYSIVDTDALLVNVDKFKKVTEHNHSVVLSYDLNGPVWDYMYAGFSYFPFTDQGLSVADFCSNFLTKMFTGDRRGFWYVDQLALFGAYVKYSHVIKLIDNKESADPYYNPEAMFWSLSNDKSESAYLKRCSEIKLRHPQLF